MSHHRIAPIPLPAFFSATIVRSDGDAAKVWIDGPKRRAEMMVAGRCVSITIIRPDRGLMYSIDPMSRTYFEIPVGDAEVAVMEANVEDDVEWELVGIADIDGRRYDEYEAWANDGECPFPRERICIDPETRMRKRITTINKRGQPVLTVNYEDAAVGPQTPDVFEVPTGYSRARLSGR
jgi:hypothetical protein